ncbi:MAG: hypothetical protein HY077_00720 [Elusimicrobia bacterium]|nr:hypothetical protein [Elusimicrobiota bacterium]
MIDPKKNGTVKDVKMPAKNGQGQAITQKPLQNAKGRTIAPKQNNITIINNKTYVTNIKNVQKNWNRNDHGYGWHRWDGHDVCHHYDRYGYHWWGWYIGSVYFWTRYYNDYYWWYDPYWHRWCYCHDGRWWWRDPSRVEYVYVWTDDGYYRYEDSDGGVVMEPDPTPPVDSPPDPEPAPAPSEKVYTSADGLRVVKISGDGKKTAYLYDTSDPPAFEPVWLGDGVDEVRFKLDDQGVLSQILTILDNGSFGVFDKDGYVIQAPGNGGVPAQPLPDPGSGTPDSSLGQSLSNSAAFRALSSGAVGW